MQPDLQLPTRPWLAFSEPQWKALLNRATNMGQRGCVRTAGNVAYLRSPIAGYRLRHDQHGTAIEIVSRAGFVTHIGRCRTAGEASDVLSVLWMAHRRPLLPDAFGGPA